METMLPPPTDIGNGTSMQMLLATQYILYGISSGGTVWQYQNEGKQWIKVGKGYTKFATNWSDLFVLDKSGNLFKFQGEPNDWLLIGKGMASIIAGGDRLYATDAAHGNIFVYENEPLGWTEIGGPGLMFVTDGFHLAGVAPDKSLCAQYVEQPPSWQQIAGSMLQQLIATDNALYGLGMDGSTLYQYQGTPMSWTSIAAGFTMFASYGRTLYASDKWMLSQYVDGIWTQVWGVGITPISSIAATAGQLFYAQGTHVWAFSIENTTTVTVASPEGPDQDLAVAGPTPTWLWCFETSDTFFSGYSGSISIDIFWTNSTHTSIGVMGEFRKGEKANFVIPMSAPSGYSIDFISVKTSDNFWASQWSCEGVTAYDIPNQKFYDFPVKKWIPVNSAATISNPAVTSFDPANLPYVTVYSWKFIPSGELGWFWGHASLMLADGTYISWWPTNNPVNSLRKPLNQMPLLSRIYSSPAVPNVTYDQDVAAETRPPDFVVNVFGLNQADILNWWNGFKGSHEWSSLSQNCSTTVADALWAGGAGEILDYDSLVAFLSMFVWTPNDIVLFAQRINQCYFETANPDQHS